MVFSLTALFQFLTSIVFFFFNQFSTYFKCILVKLIYLTINENYFLCLFYFASYLSHLKYLLPCAGEDEAPEKDDMNAKEANEPPHKKNKKHRKHKSKKKKRKKKGEKESSSESGAESDAEPAPPQRPVRTTRAR